MKRISDKELISKLTKDSESYEIKTTANQILASFEKQQESTKENTKSKFKFPMFLKVGLPTLASLCVIVILCVTLIDFTPSEVDPIPGPSDNPSILNLSSSQQEMIGRQLNTLASFGELTSSNGPITLSSIKTSSISIKDDDDDFNPNSINSVIDLYDPYSLVVLSLINNQTFDVNNKVLDDTTFANLLTLNNGEETLAIEYNLTFENEDKSRFYLEGELITTTGNYKLTISTQKEKDGEEEIETIIYYSPTNIVKIEQENEPGKFESESSLSYSTYSSEADLYFDERFINKFTYEYESEMNSDIEMEVEIENNRNEELNLEVLHHTKEEIYFEFEYEGRGESEGFLRNIVNLDTKERTYFFNNSSTPITRK